MCLPHFPALMVSSDAQLPAIAQEREHLNVPLKVTPATYHTPVVASPSQLLLPTLSESMWAAIKKIPLIGWLINNVHSFTTVLEAGKSKIKVLA